MRVLLILDWNRGRGGAEAHALRLRQGLLDAGDEVRLLVSSVGSAGDGHADYIAYGTESPAALSLLQIANPHAVATVRRAVAEFRPDVVWVNMFALQLSPAAILALGAIPKVLFVSDYKIICPLGHKLLPNGSLCANPYGTACLRSGCLTLPHWLREQARYALIRRAVQSCQAVLTCSQWVTNELAAHGISSRPLSVPIPPPPENFERRPATHPQILFVGRLDREKGVDLLLRAFARQPHARLRIAGQGPERPALENLAAALNIASQVDFLGWREPHQLESELASAWALAAPSTGAEPQGLVAIEATVRGVPAIVPDHGGLAEIVTPGESGWHFHANDESSLAEALRAACAAPLPLAPAVIEAAIRRFHLTSHVEALRRVFAELA
jgi:glycosyltransferase involved in cell wall biosynthesis